MLLGELHTNELLAELQQFPDYDAHYQPQSHSIASLKTLTKPTEIVVIVGTWCPDCHRQIPQFETLLSEASNANISVRYLGVDKQKTDPQGLAVQYDFTRLPTYIVMQNNQEVGRITERPQASLEEDLVSILS